MSVTTADDRAPSAGEEDMSPIRRLRIGDIGFFAFFVAYTAGALFLLAEGLGAVWTHLSPSLHASNHLRGLGTGLVARSALRMANESHILATPATIATGYAFSVLNLALAIFLLWLRPRDRTARLLAVGLVGTAGIFNLTAQATFEVLPLTRLESVAQSTAHIVAGVAYIYALVLFPDGRAVPRWRWPALAALYLPVTAVVAFLALRAEGVSRPATLLLFFGLGVPIAGVAAQGYRFRRAVTPAEHQQARLLFWSLLPALGVGIWFIATKGLGAANVGLAGRHLTNQPVAVFRIFQPVFLLVPLALFAGLLRYRLWDIDRVINRTLVYGLVTGILLGAYSGIVVLLQRLFSPFTGSSNLAVAVSVLAVAAAAFPARRRVQDFVDRRFYRHRYNAQQTIEAFSSRLRDQIDMETLTTELRSAVAETMQPASVSLLLRDPEGSFAWQWTYRPRVR